MSAALDFYFDFSSPYGYMMDEQIDAVAERFGRAVRRRPILLGAVFKHTGSQPLPSVPLKGPYSRHDLERTARFLALPYRLPDAFPISTHRAARAFYWLEAQDAGLARRFTQQVLRAYFIDNRDISQEEVLTACAATLGVDAAALGEAMAAEAMKTRLRTECDAALARGVFGSPFVIIDDEPFWGVDRLPQIELWLERGGF